MWGGGKSKSVSVPRSTLNVLVLKEVSVKPDTAPPALKSAPNQNQWRVAKRCEEGKWLGWDLDPPANLERALLSHRRTALFCVGVLRDVIHTHLTTLAAAPFA